jgi:site-specific recombinase XerD
LSVAGSLQPAHAAATLVKIADKATWSEKTYNNATSVLRRAFKFGYRDHPENHDPASGLKSARAVVAY